MGHRLYCEHCEECGTPITYDEYAWESAKRTGFLCNKCERERERDQDRHP